MIFSSAIDFLLIFSNFRGATRYAKTNEDITRKEQWLYAANYFDGRGTFKIVLVLTVKDKFVGLVFSCTNPMHLFHYYVEKEIIVIASQLSNRPIPGVSKDSIPFCLLKERNDKISGLLEFIGIFVNLQLKCTYLVF